MSMSAENTPVPPRRTSWASFFPRPGSSSGRSLVGVDPAKSPSVRRPLSSSGWLNGSSIFNMNNIKRPSSSGALPPTSTGRLASGSTMSSQSLRRPGSGSGSQEREIIPILSPQDEGNEIPLTDSPLVTPTIQSTPLPAADPDPAPSSTQPRLTTSTTTSSSNSPSLRARIKRGHRPATCDGAYSSFSSAPKRWASSLLLTPSSKPQALNQQASHPMNVNALERTPSQQPSNHSTKSAEKNGSSFGKSLSSMMGGLSSLSLSRTSTRDSATEEKERGRSMLKLKRPKSASQAPPENDRDSSRSVSRARSQSPFTFRRWRSRESSPTPQPIPLSQSEADFSDTSSVLPRNTAYTDDDSGDDTVGTDAETDDAYSSGEEFDPITERNTEHNALIAPVTDPSHAAEIEDADPVGEGPNVVIAPEPYFPTTLNSSASTVRGKRNPRRRKSVKTHENLPFQTSRPVFQRDRCTITIKQGDPAFKLGERRRRRYVVASDLSEESRYAVEWGIGTVLRDGDEMLIVTVVENDSKVDPLVPNAADRTTKLRAQQERQGLAYILVRQATGLLQRTGLNVTIQCQAWHAKNSRHMLLDVVDHIEPTMLIVGSRGLGQLNGILLGSTSHYLIQKCSVPVMVARRRLKRPPRKSAHLLTRRTHVSLAEAGIDRVAAKVDQDVQVMRDEIQKDDNRRDGGPGSRDERFAGVPEGDPQEEDEGEDDNDDEPAAIKIAG